MFRPIPGYDGRYLVDPSGNILSKRKDRLGRVYKDRYMTQFSDKNGYQTVHLRKGEDGARSCSFRVARAVALAFIPNPDNKPEVNHIDGNKLNNHVSNLEWVTAKENHHHARQLGLREHTYNFQPVAQIDRTTGEVIKVHKSLSDAGKDIGINPTGISMVLSGKRKSAGGYYWRRFNDYPQGVGLK